MCDDTRRSVFFFFLVSSEALLIKHLVGLYCMWQYREQSPGSCFYERLYETWRTMRDFLPSNFTLKQCMLRILPNFNNTITEEYREYNVKPIFDYRHLPLAFSTPILRVYEQHRSVHMLSNACIRTSFVVLRNPRGQRMLCTCQSHEDANRALHSTIRRRLSVMLAL